jgi:phytoene dehydrogenase-like protein
MSTHSDFIVIGAGLAGLNATLLLQSAGHDVMLLESSHRVGGRVKTDTEDGLLFDHGFQLLNPAYPELKKLDILHELDLREFVAGVELVMPQGHYRLADPRKKPTWLFDATIGRYATPIEKLQIIAAASRILKKSIGKKIQPSLASVETEMISLGVPKTFYDALLKPFLTGVFLADPAKVSASYGEFVIRSFFNGTPAVPAKGMGELTEVIAARLAPGTVKLGVHVKDIKAGKVFTDDDEMTADKIIIATNPSQMNNWFPNLPNIETVGCTTWYHVSETRVKADKTIRIDGAGRGPILNSVVMSEVAPGYASRGRSLISTTTLGAGGVEVENQLQDQLELIWGKASRNWMLARRFEIPEALPLLKPGAGLQLPVSLGNNIFIAGDHRDTPSQEGALLSGRRAAAAALR